MDSVFFYQLTLHRDSAEGSTFASWVSKLPLIQQVTNQVVVLTGTEGLQQQGMYVWDGTKWRLVLPYEAVCAAIIENSTIDVFYAVDVPYAVSPRAVVWKNNTPFTGTTIGAGDGSVWAVLTPPLVVTSVNDVDPDVNGNVSIGISNIPGLEAALASAGSVKTVNGESPDSNGNVEVPTATTTVLGTVKGGANVLIAPDGTLSVNITDAGVQTVSGQAPDTFGNVAISAADSLPASGNSLIVNSGATTGTIVLSVIVAGAGIFVTPGVGTLTFKNTGVLTINGSGPDGAGNVAVPTYTLPIATSSVLGGVKIGTNVNVAGDGTISVTFPTPYTLPVATSVVLGGVKQGANVTIAGDGTISVEAPPVISVSGQVGAVVVQTIDNDVASGTSLIVDSGATTGTAKLKTLVAGTSITIVPDVNGNLVINSATGVGSVQSVALALPSIFAVSGSPVTSTGTLTGTLVGQNANWAFMGPVSGSADIPAFRAMVSADTPIATTAARGAVIVGAGLAVNGTGVISNAGVTTFNTRSGAVVLTAGDLQVPITGAFLLDSPSFTGVPTAATAAANTNTTQLATTAFVQAAILGFSLPPATTSTLGGVIVGSGLAVNGSGLLSNSGVTSFNLRSGAVTLIGSDMVNSVNGNFLVSSPQFVGVPTAPTAAPGNNTLQLATTAFVQAAVTAGAVTSFNTRVGAVTLQTTDLQVGGVGSGAFILGSPIFTGIPTAPTAAANNNTTQIATTAYVASYAPLANPALTGVPTAPTAATATNTTQIATTAFVQALVAASGVSSFNSRTGAVTLLASDLQVGGTGAFILNSPQFSGTPSTPTAAGPSGASLQVANLAFIDTYYAPLASPALTGVPTAPTATSGNNTTQIATTAFVTANFVTSVSPALSGTPTAPTAAPGTNTTQIATTAFAQALFSSLTLPPATTSTLGGVIIKTGLTVDGSGNLSANVTSVAGRGGVVTLSISDVSGAAPLASPVFTGNPTTTTAPTTGDNSQSLANTGFVQTAIAGTSTISITGSHTLNAQEYSVPIIVLIGALTVNAVITFPTTGKWSVENSTSGAFTVTLQAGTGSGSTIVIPSGATADVIAVSNSLLFSGQLGITRALNDSTTYVATTAYVMNALGSLATGVTSFGGRTGAVTLQASDMQVGGTGAFILGSPQFTGVPIAPTATAGTNTTQLATTAFVATSFAPLASPAFTGVPVAPTATAGTSTTQLATTAFVATSYAPLASPSLTGTPLSPTAAQGTNTTQIATTAFVQRMLAATVSIALTNANVTLTAAQYSTQIIEFTGALTASVTITVPTSGQWIMYNNTTGAFNVTISNGSGSTYVVPQNESASVLSLVTLGIVNANIAGFTLTPATATTLGGVIVPNAGGLVVDVSGNISVSAATASVIGGVIIGAGLTITGSTVSANVTTVAGRTGAILLAVGDVSGAAPLASPTFTGVPIAPTATAGTSTTQIATTAFVATSYAPLASPTLTGTPLAPTAAIGTNTTQIATTAYVYSAVHGAVSVALAASPVTLTAVQYGVQIIIFTGTLTANVVVTVPTTGEWIFYNITTGAFTVTISSGTGTTQVIPQSTTQATPLLSNATNGVVQVLSASSGVASFGGRTGAVTLQASDMQVGGTGAFILTSPQFTGSPTSTTPSPGDSSTNIATTAFVATSYAPLTSPTFVGVPAAPTATVGTSTTQLATTAFVQTAINGASSVTLGSANVTLTAAQYSVPAVVFTGTLTANVIVTVPTTGEWVFYNNTTGAFTVTISNGTGTTQVITQSTTQAVAMLSNAANGVVPVGASTSGVTSVNGFTGVVVLGVANISGAAPLASPTFTGVPAAPTATAGTNTTQIATTAFVATSYAPLASPTFTGVPAAPTATAGTNTTQLATTAFVATSYAPLASPTFTGAPLAPTATAGTNNTQLASTLYVYNATQGQSTIPLTNANVTLTAAQYSNPYIKFTGTLTGNVIITFPTAGNWNVFNATTGAFTLTLSNGAGATPILGTNLTLGVLSDSTSGMISGSSSGGAVTSVNTLTGAVVLGVANISGAAPLASPTFTGTPAAPTATAGTNTTQLATTQFVTSAVSTAVSPLAPLASPTFTGRAQSPAYSFSTSALGSVSGTQTLNLGLFTEFTMTITAATTFAFTNTLASNTSEVVFLKMTNAGAFTITWPASTKFAAKTAPTFTTSGVDIVGVLYDTDTATYMVLVVGLNIG